MMHSVTFSLVDCWWLVKERVVQDGGSESLLDVQSDVLSPSRMNITTFSTDQQYIVYPNEHIY